MMWLLMWLKSYRTALLADSFQLPKLALWVRFPSSAPNIKSLVIATDRRFSSGFSYARALQKPPKYPIKHYKGVAQGVAQTSPHPKKKPPECGATGGFIVIFSKGRTCVRGRTKPR